MCTNSWGAHQENTQNSHPSFWFRKCTGLWQTCVVPNPNLVQVARLALTLYNYTVGIHHCMTLEGYWKVPVIQQLNVHPPLPLRSRNASKITQAGSITVHSVVCILPHETWGEQPDRTATVQYNTRGSTHTVVLLYVQQVPSLQHHRAYWIGVNVKMYHEFYYNILWYEYYIIHSYHHYSSATVSIYIISFIQVHHVPGTLGHHWPMQHCDKMSESLR